MDILNEVVTGRTRQTRHLKVSSHGVEQRNAKLTYQAALCNMCELWKTLHWLAESPAVFDAIRESFFNQWARFSKPAIIRRIHHE